MVFHELVAHKGLREVLAPDAFNSMLDSVSSRHGGEARFREIAKRYHLNLETENGRREAAEEYIAHLAEERNEALKPSWWREFLAQVKQLLRRLPYLDRVRWSDREIEALLRRSARAMRRRNRAGRNAASGVRFAVKGDENAFQDIYDKADAHEKEAIDAYRYAMNGASVAELSGNEFQKDNIPITDKVTAYFAEQCNGVAVNPEIGAVRLDREGVKDSLGHGIGRIKAAAYAAVPQIIENGKICDRQENWKGRGYDTVVIVAPLEIAGKPYIGEVVVQQRTNRQGFYLHEVELKEKLENAFKTPTEGSAFPASRLILSQLLDKIKLKYGKNDGNVRFSIIGEEGAAAAAEWYGRQDAEMWKMLGLDLSTQQGNAVRRLEDLSVAKRMAEAGKEAETIKLATGWEKGADGKWRTETDDNWQFSPEFLRLEPYESLPIDRCIQEGTELFSAYPELREFNVRLSTSLEMQQSKGWFDREGEEIVLQQDGLPAMKKTLIHEIQHYIQEQEGFAPGGNLNTASRLAATGNYSSTELADAYRKFHDNVKLLPGDLYENIGRVLHEDSFRNFRDVLGEELGELWGSKETAIDFMRNAYDSSNRETFLQIYEAELEKAEKGHPDAFSLYRRLAGEVEARNAEKRSGLSLEERLRTLLANTEDVAEQDKIYLEKNTADLPLSREEEGGGSMKNPSSKDIDSYQEYLDRLIENNILSLRGEQRKMLEQFYHDFPLGKEIVNKLGERFYFQPFPGGNLNDYIHHFAVKRTKSRGVYKESFSKKFMQRFQDIDDTIRNYDRRILGISNDGQPRLYFYRKLDENHVTVVTSDPDGRLLPWTHFEPTDSYITHRLLEPEKQLIATHDIIDQNGKHYSPEEYERLKEDIPLYLATAEGSLDLTPQAANPAANTNITSSGEKSSENPARFSESGQAEELANLMAKRVAPIICDANGRDSDVREEVRTLLSQEGFNTPSASDGDNSLLTFRFVALYSLQNRIHDNDGKPDRQKNQSVPEGEEPYHQGVLRTLQHQHRFGQPARTRHRQPEFECASPHQPDAGNLALLPLPRGDRQRFSDPPPRGARTHSQPRRKGRRLFQPHPRPAEVRRRTPPHGAAPRVRNQRRFLPALRGGDRLSGPR